MSKPCALIASCSAFQSSELIKQILSTDSLPTPTALLENINAYPWHIETKYYTADISLCTSDNRTIGNESFANSVQAFVCIVDTTQQSSFDQVRLWLPYLRELQPMVQILVCNRCSDNDAVSRDVAINWCLDNSFELVELDPLIEEDDGSDEDDFKETVGVKRIVEALSCHSWSNLIMKDKPAIGGSFLFEQLLSETLSQGRIAKCADNAETVEDSEDNWSPFVASDSPANSENSQQNHSTSHPSATGVKTPEELIDSIVDQDSAAGVDSTGHDGMDEESFEKLFDQLRIMKDAAAVMTTDQRKKYAEKVTMQFWQALGGNLDEFEGLSSDDDLAD